MKRTLLIIALMTAALVIAGLTSTNAYIANTQGSPERFYLAAGSNAPVPEPATMVLLGTGLAAIAARMRKRLKASQNSK